MNIHPIRTKADYKRARREVSAYFDNEPEPGSDDGDRVEILATLVEAYGVLDTHITRVRAFLQEQGVPAEAISVR